MQRSTERFLTTHTGSLPRPDDLIRMMYAKEEGVPVEPDALAARMRAAVDEVVGKQVKAGIDIDQRRRNVEAELRDLHQGSAERLRRHRQHLRLPGSRRVSEVWPSACSAIRAARAARRRPATRPISVRDPRAAQDRRRQSQGRARQGRRRRRPSSARPRPAWCRCSSATIITRARRLPVRHRRGDAARIRDDRQRRHRAADRLSRSRHGPAHPVRRPEPRRNSASGASCTSRRSITRSRNIAPERMRMHLCWGNYEGPHHCDVPLADIVDIVFTARPSGDLVRGRQSAPRARMDVVRDASSCPRAKC